ncbi:MAG: hypothetical protein KUG76_05650 [Gammaproteobacteria bacterium]|nr:hypothetical protein [Gammaproteobacteria bacterium]
MRCLNETVARIANKEDRCAGRFSDKFCSCKTCIHHIPVNKSHFKRHTLLGEKALLFCMAYVDLNPVRAKMAPTPEESDFTSIQERLFDHGKRARHPSPQQKYLAR